MDTANPHGSCTSCDGSRLAGVIFRPGLAINDVMADVIAQLLERGVTLAGVSQVISDEMENGRTMVLRDLSGRWEVPIMQPLGTGSHGCTLDPGALLQASEYLSNQMPSAVDFVVLNRFGKAEVEGRGLRSVIERCVLDGIRVIVPVREDYREAWYAFHGGMAVELPADSEAIVEWCRAVLGQPVAPGQNPETSHGLGR